jgi:negative regulator of flagellin synthesis FlgM
MINVNGVQPAGSAGAVEPVGKAMSAPPAAASQGVSDVVEISLAARLTAKLQEAPAIRADLVAKVKAEIASGVYETPERLDVAVDRLLKDIL